MRRILHLTVLTLMLAPSFGSAQDFQTGLTAAKSGDYATALREWSPLAAQGDATAQYSLGVLYGGGLGVLQDYTEAVKWYRLAAEQDDPLAQYNLGVMNEHGYGIPQDHGEAAKWYRLAAGQGNLDAQFNLGVLHANGNGVPQDDITAHMWYNIAASKGDETAASNREAIAGRMEPGDISEAQRKAKACLASGYSDCD